MTKNSVTLLSILLCAGSAQAQITNPSPYCAAGYDDHIAPVPHYIKSVKLSTLNNTSGTTQFAAPHYAYYNNITAADLNKGSSYNLSIEHSGMTIHWVVAYIDFNRNNSFDDPGERVFQQKTMAITNPATTAVSIPATAATGITRMRIMVFEDDNFTAGSDNAKPCTADASGSFDWGETEDYNVNIKGTTTAINEISKWSGTNFIYPNPAKDRLFLNEVIRDATIKIADIHGRIVLEQIGDMSKGVDVSSMKTGTYFMKIINDKGVFKQTLVIEK